MLLHGDLWVSGKRTLSSPGSLGKAQAGNTGTDNLTGEPIIFDPSSYFGHNESEYARCLLYRRSAVNCFRCSLAIARMFSGFSQSFFTTYHEHLPKTEPVEEYELRGALYELYHYLNHTVLFGVKYYFGFQLPWFF